MAIKTYSYKKNKKISTHFRARDFASTNGFKVYSDKVLVDTNFIARVEKFFKYGLTIKPNSGYRTKQHDIDVGGNGKGAHTRGFALDLEGILNGKKVPAKYMTCLAEILGFSGIGIINSNSIHVDGRTKENYDGNYHWFGDERPSSRTDTISSFFNYYSTSEAELYGYLGYYKKKLFKIQAKKKSKIRKSPKSDGTFKKYYPKGKKAYVYAEKNGYYKVASGWIKKSDVKKIK